MRKSAPDRNSADLNSPGKTKSGLQERALLQSSVIATAASLQAPNFDD